MIEKKARFRWLEPLSEVGRDCKADPKRNGSLTECSLDERVIYEDLIGHRENETSYARLICEHTPRGIKSLDCWG